MIATTTEFKANIGKYLSLAESEDILITKNGQNIAKLVSAKHGILSALRLLRGVLKSTNLSLESIREERLAKYD